MEVTGIGNLIFSSGKEIETVVTSNSSISILPSSFWEKEVEHKVSRPANNKLKYSFSVFGHISGTHFKQKISRFKIVNKVASILKIL
jgi:hypothetical protein